MSAEVRAASAAPTEREKWEREMSLREQDMALKARETVCREGDIEIKRREQAASGWRNPVVVAIMAAAAAGLGNAGVSLTNGRFQRELEDQKSEQIRILEMIKTGDADKAAENLSFLLDAGLISTPALVARLRNFLEDREPGSGPTLPSVTASAFGGNSLAERVEALRPSAKSKVPGPNAEYAVQNHVLLDRDGSPVSIVEATRKGSRMDDVSLVVLHCTATQSSRAVSTWFSSAQANNSAHLVIDRDGSVIQLVAFDIRAAHAGASRWMGRDGVNGFSIGIEFVNACRLQKKGTKWTVSGEAQEVAESDVYISTPAAGSSDPPEYWQTYTEAQLHSAEAVIRALASAYPSLGAVVGHSQVSPGRRLDPGPALPIDRLQAALDAARASSPPGGPVGNPVQPANTGP